MPKVEGLKLSVVTYCQFFFVYLGAPVAEDSHEEFAAWLDSTKSECIFLSYLSELATITESFLNG